MADTTTAVSLLRRRMIAAGWWQAVPGGMRAVLAGFDMTTKRSGSAELDCRHDARFDAAKMAVMG